MEGVAELDEARLLVARLGIKGAGDMLWIVSDDPDRPPANSGQPLDDRSTPRRSNLEERPAIHDRFDHRPDVVGPAKVLGKQCHEFVRATLDRVLGLDHRW